MLATFFIIIGILLRLIPHPYNFTPITAFALFGGTYINKKLAFIIPLTIIIISDFLLSPKNMFHSTTLFVWGSFLISGLIGLWIKKNRKPLHILSGTLLASLQFFFITN